jgi:hypothetical protein
MSGPPEDFRTAMRPLPQQSQWALVSPSLPERHQDQKSAPFIWQTEAADIGNSYLRDRSEKPHGNVIKKSNARSCHKNVTGSLSISPVQAIEEQENIGVLHFSWPKNRDGAA